MIAVLFALRREIGRLRKESPDGVVFCQTGMGIAAAHEATERFLESHEPELIVSVGYAGATTAALKTGDLVIATEVRSESGDLMRPDPGGRLRLTKGLKDRGISFFEGPLLTVWNPLKTPSEKEIAGSRGVIACDMETAAIAAVAEKSRRPWISLRVVFDPMEEELDLRNPFKIPKMIRWHLKCRRGLNDGVRPIY